MESPEPLPFAARLIAGVFGFVFGGIGLSVLGFLWLSEDGFHSPPLFFKIFGSLIALPFVAIGGTLFIGAVMGRQIIGKTGRIRNADEPAPPSSAATGAGAGYRCPRCGAPLGKDAEVSPSGDVKCAFCNTWFNIHRPNP